jgi:RHS repeat-associated protein
VVTYTYDLASRQTGVSDTSTAFTATPSGPLTYATTTTYDPLNRPTGVTFGNVPAATAPTTGVNVAFTRAYNAVNQRTGQAVSDSAWIDYPPATASTTAYTANALNQYTAVGAVTPAYDSNGNTTSDGTSTLGYDAENRLVSASKTGMTATYTFDGRGRRKTKTVNGTTTVFVTDADNREVLEYDGSSGAILRWYAYGLGSNDVLAQVEVSGGTRLTPVPDLQGSVIATMSNAGTLASFAYRAYGTSASAPAAFGYTGQRVDAETGSYYYRARHLSPGWGRFWQADPIGYGDGMLIYAYVGNDPLNAIDSFGLDGSRSSPPSYLAFVGPLLAPAATEGAALSVGAIFGSVLLGGSALLTPNLFSSMSATDACSTAGCSDSNAYHRVETPIQTPEIALRQQLTGEIWGSTPRLGGMGPTVNAYLGPLPPGERGIEFSTRITPGSAQPFPGGLVRWYGGSTPGVIVNDQGYAVLPVLIYKNTQVPR